MTTIPQLKIGLEIHTQLQTASKLFSLSKNITSDLSIKPNTTTSFFDVSLPGTQPLLNPQCLLNSIKLALSLNCEISKISKFDRKHYFYGDQPLGYQITQHFNPIAKNGYLKLFKKHNPKLNNDLIIRIQQLQLEQDTGRSIYKFLNSNFSNIDFNRSNLPLIEMVTLPDFKNVEEVRIFLQNYIKLVQNLNICTGDLESGSLRVDVNINVTGHQRVEIKNLPTISAIINAIRFEEKRQLNVLKNFDTHTDTDTDIGSKEKMEIETRGWDGKKTYHLRFKESNVDYRYIPDLELPRINLNLDNLLPIVRKNLPMSIEDKLNNLIDNYNLNLRDAKILVNNIQIETFFLNCWSLLEKYPNIRKNNLINWLVHELLGTLTKSEIAFDTSIIDSKCFTNLILLVENDKKITKSNGKLLLLHLVNNRNDQNKKLLDLADEFNMLAENSNFDVSNLIVEVLAENDKIVTEIKNGKTKKINFLIGQCMRKSGGNIQPSVFEDKIKHFLDL